MANVTGTEQVIQELARVMREWPPQIAQALYQEAEEIMTLSKREYVPVDLGALRASGFVKLPEQVNDTKWRVVMGYGGPAIPYAIVQHERLDYRHTVGGAKYLERPVNLRSEGMAGRILARVNLR